MSSNTGGGAGSGGPDQFTQNSMRAQSLSKGESAKSMDDLIKQILEGPVKWLSKATGVNLNSFLNTGVVAGLEIEKAAALKVDDQVNKLAQNLTFAGGFVAKTFLDNIKWDLSAIGSLPIEAQSQVNSIRDMQGEGMPVVAMSNENLGNIMPMDTPGMQRSQGMGMSMGA